MAVWICLNFTKPSAPTNRSVRVSIINIRLAMNFSSSTWTVERDASRSTLPADVQQHAAINAVAVPGLLAEKGGCVVLTLQRDESVITPQPPAARVPAHAAADVAGEERLRVVDAKRLLFEEAQATNATRHIRHHRRAVRG